MFASCCSRSRGLNLAYRFAKKLEWQKVGDVKVNFAVRGPVRNFSTQIPPDDPQAQFKPEPPKEMNMEIAEGIQNANKLILRHGVGNQRLKLLAQTPEMPLVLKWQRMMEIYLGAQLHVVAALGYDTNENGIVVYTQQLAKFVSTCDPDSQENFRKVGRDTWRDMLSTAFDLDEELLNEKASEEMSIVDARNTVHKVASRLMEPVILEAVAERIGKMPPRKLGVASLCNVPFVFNFVDTCHFSSLFAQK